MAAIVARSDAPQGGTKLVVCEQRGDPAVSGRLTAVAARQQLSQRAAVQIASSPGGEPRVSKVSSSAGVRQGSSARKPLSRTWASS